MTRRLVVARTMDEAMDLAIFKAKGTERNLAELNHFYGAWALMPHRFLSGKECAERLGILPDTWTSYRARRRTPDPDVYIGGTPGWLPETIDGWQRPGQGARRPER